MGVELDLKLILGQPHRPVLVPAWAQSARYRMAPPDNVTPEGMRLLCHKSQRVPTADRL